MREKAKQLDVEGQVRCASLIVKTNGWGDDVFAADYQLTPLGEVAAFIGQHQHLPGVPSEQELVAKGINAAEMAETQMRKIEELTLYAIEQEKRAKKQDEAIAALVNRITELEAKAR